MNHEAVTRRIRRGIFARLLLKLAVLLTPIIALLSWLIFPNAAVWANATDAMSATSAQVRLAALKALGGKPTDAAPEPKQSNSQLDSIKKANGYAANELRCLAVAIYFEAGRESREAQVAVGQIVLNRARERKAPRELCRVVYNGLPNACLFETTCRNLGTAPALGEQLASAIEVARAMAQGEAAPGRHAGATHFHERSARPAWSRDLFKLGGIGKLEFYSTEQPADAGQAAPALAEKGEAPRPVSRRSESRSDSAKANNANDSKSLARQVFGTD